MLLLDADAPPEKSRTMDVLIDWPAASQAPTLFAFIASESRAPRSVQAALEAEQEARATEETNALYVAATRAQNTLVISSCQPHNADPLSPWQRFAQIDATLVQDVAVPMPADEANAQAQLLQKAKALATEVFYLPNMPAGSAEYAQAAIKNIVITKPSSEAQASQPDTQVLENKHIGSTSGNEPDSAASRQLQQPPASVKLLAHGSKPIKVGRYCSSLIFFNNAVKRGSERRGSYGGQTRIPLICDPLRSS